MILPLLVMEWFLVSFFPITHSLIEDWFNIFYNFTLFFYGFLFIFVQKPFSPTVQKYYKTYLYLGIMDFQFLYILLVYSRMA